ncbi:MAG: type II secretion system GspH family protein [Coriobacteriales bacterium]|nr:type II secretion system GspH family protein [Coriobacteriales bacterium]
MSDNVSAKSTRNENRVKGKGEPHYERIDRKSSGGGALSQENSQLSLLDEKALKLSDKKGFTLIEAIVVLVILGIMAALIVPALTGYIEKANQRTVIAEAGTYRTALQTIGTEVVANGGTLPGSNPSSNNTYDIRGSLSNMFPKLYAIIDRF